MNATTQLQDTLAQMAALQNQINAISDKASRASAVTSQAGQRATTADTLKQQRRGLLARLFLGDAPADTSEIDSQIRQAQSAAAGMQDDAEAAQMALDTLSAQASVITRQRQQLQASLPGLHHAVLTAQANATDAYAAKVAS